MAAILNSNGNFDLRIMFLGSRSCGNDTKHGPVAQSMQFQLFLDAIWKMGAILKNRRHFES